MNPEVSAATEPWKIGFHLGPGGNPTGIGDFMRLMLEYKRAPFIKSADHYGPLFELDGLRKEYGHDALSLPAVVGLAAALSVGVVSYIAITLLGNWVAI